MTEEYGEKVSEMMKTPEASRLLEVHPQTLKRLIKSGKIKTFLYPGKTRRYPKSEIERLQREGF